eukprot:3375487-Pyramimonas_sp.AAC.2
MHPHENVQGVDEMESVASYGVKCHSGKPRCLNAVSVFQQYLTSCLHALGHRYSAPLYVDLTKTVTTMADGPDGEPEVEQEELPKVFIGKVPIMLRSQYCSLYDHTDKELAELGECQYDQVSVPLYAGTLGFPIFMGPM